MQVSTRKHSSKETCWPQHLTQ